jgi:UDP-GlcNAc3NAcA epimerase
VIEPVGFIDMIRLEMGALAIASDSGGVQKEAFFYRVPCFILRDETEWVELVDAGWNTVLPPEDAERMAATMLALDSRRPREISPYGEGNASHIIVDELVKRYGG